MNVLIFVMTMLMLLSLMTYARLDSFRNSQAFQTVFKTYMEEDERHDINYLANKNYETIKLNEKKTNDKLKKPKIDASPRIGVGLFFDENREAKSKEWSQTKILFKNLIQTLYSKQKFYKDIEQEHPAFIDDLIKSMITALDGMDKQKKLNPKASDLANLSLQDPQLDYVLYQMLEGALYSNLVPEEFLTTHLIKENTNESEVESIEESDVNQDVDDYKSPKGYYSLLDFITNSPKPTIRVYLASKEVLQSIFHDPATVNAILEERQNLYRQADADNDVNALSDHFKNQFLRLKDPAIDEATLNFSVTKTNPKYYQ